MTPDYSSRFRTRPGITGLAQVSGYRGEITSHEDLIRRIEHDLAYIENWSLRADFGVLLRTLKVGAFHPTAY